MNDRTGRRSILRRFGASEDACDEVLAYTDVRFQPPSYHTFPLQDEQFVSVWRDYADVARSGPPAACLRERLVQLRFPVEKGMSETYEYQLATKQGILPSDSVGVVLHDPDQIQIEIHPTAAGHIPLIVTTNRSDFVSLVQALVRRNEPHRIPDSMGACMVAGYNNWDRVRRYRRDWEASHQSESWTDEFMRFAGCKELYQDRFIILSDGWYSGVPGASVGLPDDVWRSISLIIRREHECAHYFTRRVLGSMRNNLHDELLADYMGIVEVAGRFRADWFLLFMGLEAYPRYRFGGRFENYVDGLSEEAVRVLQRLVVAAAKNLERMHAAIMPHPISLSAKARAIVTLASMSLECLSDHRPTTSNSTIKHAEEP